MQKTIAMTDFERGFQSIVDEVVEAHVPYVLTCDDRPRAALISYEDYLRLEKLSQDLDTLRDFDAMWARMDARTAGVDESEIAADIAVARAELPG